MKTSKILCLISFVAATSLSHATIIFQSDGVKSGWNHELASSGGQVSQVSSPTYNSDGQAIKHYGPSGQALNVHAEVAEDPAGYIGNNYYYGWAFMIGSDWPSSLQKGSVLCQMSGRASCWNQLDFLQIKGTTFTDSTGSGDSCNPTSHTYTIATSIPSRNVWHRLEIHKKWATDSTGLTHIWLDGTIKVQADNVATAFNGMGSVAWHVGVYAGYVSGETGTRTVWTDHARIATSYNEADPTQW